MRRIDPWFAIGLFALFALLFVALFGERVASHEPIYFVVDHGDDVRPYSNTSSSGTASDTSRSSRSRTATRRR